jgi:CubicO group peptidase (beta-lactamase class C family)
MKSLLTTGSRFRLVAMPNAPLRIIVALAVMSIGLGSPSTARAALGEPVQAASIEWWWYYGQSPDQVSSLLLTNNARLVSLRVQSSNPLRFDVAMVQNTNTFAKTWWWYYGQTAEQLANLATAHDARIVNLEPYMVNGTTYFAAIMLHNVGADYSGWWWYYGLTPDQVKTRLSENDARLIDLRQYDGGVYAVVMISNTGSNQSNWWWYYNITADQVKQYISDNNAYLISLDPNPDGSTFNVVLNAYPGGFNWWWYYGESAAAVTKLIQANAARIFDLKTYTVNGNQVFAALMLGDTWNSTQSADASCDSNVVGGWHSTLPALGLGLPSATAPYDSTFTALMNKYGVPGGAVAVMKNGKLVVARGYGLSDIGNSLIVHPDSLFRIASLSKQITSAAVLQLVQNKKLSLAANPFSLLGLSPDPSGQLTSALSGMTIGELLQHTGGWSRETGCSNCSSEGDPMFESETIATAQGKVDPPSCTRIIKYMLTQPVYWTPGAVYDYSNFGYCVLGQVIAKETGQSYADYVRTNILNPAGAGGIVQGRTIWPTDREVVYYDYPGAGSGQDVFAPSLNAFTNPYGNFYLEAMAAHGAWVASPVDLLRFQGAIDGRTGVAALLNPTSIGDMTANPGVPVAVVNSSNKLVTQPQSGSWYGMGWSVNTAGNWWHNGSLPGTQTEQVHAENGFGFAAFFNTRPSNSDGFGGDLDNALWNAFNAVGPNNFGSVDLFDQYGSYTDWMNGTAYQSKFNSEKAGGKYPSRVEGFSDAGTPLYRAAFAPVPASVSAWQSRHGIDCPTYKSLSDTLRNEGYQNASLQSFVSSDGTRRYQATWVKW